MTKFTVTEYGTTFDTYEVEAKNRGEAEELVAAGKAIWIESKVEHDFFETREVKNG